jgi:hypothetical protein
MLNPPPQPPVSLPIDDAERESLFVHGPKRLRVPRPAEHRQRRGDHRVLIHRRS